MTIETQSLVRPPSLEPGRAYLQRDKRMGAGEGTWAEVSFIKEDPCPAWVIVENGKGRVRCLREDLFLP